MYGRSEKSYVIISVLFIYLFASATFGAKTWKLEGDKGFEVVSDSPQDKLTLAIKKLKSTVDQGQVELIVAQAEKIKTDFPNLAGKDFDEFLKGEIAYAEGEFPKAVRAYTSMMSKYPQSRFLDAALEREFLIAQAYLNGHKKKVLKIFKIKGYAEGVKVMDKVIEKAGNSPLAVKGSMAIAQSYESRAKYADAYERWSKISSLWPTGKTGKTALLAMARCKHAAYKGPDYDVSDLISAQSYYENFSKRYPEDAEKYEIEKRLIQIEEQIAYKEYKIAEYYHRTGSDNCARYYCDDVQNNWSKTTSAKRASNIVEKIENTPKEEPQKENKWNIKKLIMP